MKKFVCCLFAAVIAVTMAGAQELLVSESNFSAVPGAGQSEVIINFVGSQSVLVSINGARAIHLMPEEITKIVVNNGSVSIEAETYYYTSKTSWARWGKAAAFDLSPNSQSIQIRVSNRANGNITISQINTKPLEMQNSGAQIPYGSSNIENAVKYSMEVMLEDIPAMPVVAVISVASGDREMTEYVISEIENLLVNNNLEVVDRRMLDAVMQEQNFQMTGDVDGKSAVSIGKLLEANIVITGSINGSGTTRRLRLTAINVQTGEIAAMTSERF